MNIKTKLRTATALAVACSALLGCSRQTLPQTQEQKAAVMLQEATSISASLKEEGLDTTTLNLLIAECSTNASKNTFLMLEHELRRLANALP